MKTIKNLDIDLLRTFIAVVDNGTVTRAALQIHRSQSAISMQIKRLEQQLEQVLFERSKRSLLLTQQGKNVVAYARRLLKLNDQALLALTNTSNSALLRIGCPDDYSLTILPTLIEKLRSKSPNMQLSIITANSGELRQLLDNNEIDLAILTRLHNSNEGVLIYQEKGAWAATNSEALQQRPLPLVLFEPTCKYHSQVIDGLEKSGISYDLVCSASHVSLLQSLVKKGVGVSVMPKRVIPKELLHENVAMMAELPVVEVILSGKGAEQVVAGCSLVELANELSNTIG